MSKEADLYPPMIKQIETRWADTPPHDYIEPDRFRAVLDTHGRKGGGRWSAPDITLLGGKTLPYLPGKFLDVVTFEVKPWLDITGLYEALSHRTHATHAYLIGHHPESWGEPDDQMMARITREATRTGVGFIRARRPDDYSTWTEIVPARRWVPEPEALHDFVRSLELPVLRTLRDWLQRDPFLGDRPKVDFANLGLNEDDQILAEKIYMEIPVEGRGTVGWKHFAGSFEKSDVERIRRCLRAKSIIETVQKGGMYIPANPGR